MAYLVDTNVLVRWAEPTDPDHSLATEAVETLILAEQTLYITPQNLTELWNVATRPKDQNGFGLTPAQADQMLKSIEQVFPLSPDIPTIHTEWRQLAVSASVSGRQVHDARLVAVMMAHGLTHLLTFNTTDFVRYPNITVVHPQDVQNNSSATDTPEQPPQSA